MKNTDYRDVIAGKSWFFTDDKITVVYFTRMSPGDNPMSRRDIVFGSDDSRLAAIHNKLAEALVNHQWIALEEN